LLGEMEFEARLGGVDPAKAQRLLELLDVAAK